MKAKSNINNQLELSHAHIHYLKAVHELYEQNGYVRAIDLTNYTGKTKGTISVAIQKLLLKEYIILENNKFIKLTPKGNGLSNRYIGAKKLLTSFFHEILNVPFDIAEEDACRVENHLSKNTIESLVKYMNLKKNNNNKDP